MACRGSVVLRGRWGRWIAGATATMVLGAGVAGAQVSGCVAKPAAAPSAADTALAGGSYEQAEGLYRQQMTAQPNDAQVAAGLVQALLHEGKTGSAEGTAETALKDSPNSAVLLTAQAEVRLKRGQPWLAMESANAAVAADPCDARALLVRSRTERIDSMYASERKDIAKAYELAPKDPEVLRAWRQTVEPATEIAGTQEYLATTKNVDAELRRTAELSVASMMPLLAETSQNCKGLPTVKEATLPLVASRADGQHVDGYKLEMGLGKTQAKLIVDTAASGLYISRVLADANVLEHGEGDPPGTVRASVVTVGPMEFHDCLVGVNDAPFPEKGDGYVGTDLFGSYLITLDMPGSKLDLQPLPAPVPIPMDRPKAAEVAELAGFQPVYHRAQYLLVPVTLNERERRLFVLDTGIRLSTMMPGVASMASPNDRAATSPMPTTDGKTLQVYRNSFDFEFVNLRLPHQGHILELDSATIEDKLGMEIGGLLGFDLLHAMRMHLDYRDGLAKFEPVGVETAPASGILLAGASGGAGGLSGGGVTSAPVCEARVAPENPTGATIAATTTGMWDSAHMKPGQRVTAKLGVPWRGPGCDLQQGALLYGHITAATGSQPALGLQFDHADCNGRTNQPVALEIVSVVAPPGEFKGLQTELPVSIGGGLTRSIGDTVPALENGTPQNLAAAGIGATVKTGSVLGMPKVTLAVDGGPGCSAELKTTDRSVRLGTGTTFLLVMPAAP